LSERTLSLNLGLGRVLDVWRANYHLTGGRVRAAARSAFNKGFTMTEIDRGYAKAKERDPGSIEERKRLEWELEEGLKETFPGSDAVTVTQPVKNRPPVKKRPEW
jgi:nicotinate phosphoribosyltransferase